jgi:hypothetical protein
VPRHQRPLRQEAAVAEVYPTGRLEENDSDVIGTDRQEEGERGRQSVAEAVGSSSSGEKQHGEDKSTGGGSPELEDYKRTGEPSAEDALQQESEDTVNYEKAAGFQYSPPPRFTQYTL